MRRHLVRLAHESVGPRQLGFTTEAYSDELYARTLHQHTSMVEAITAGRCEHAATLADEHFPMTRLPPFGCVALLNDGPRRTKATEVPHS